MINIFKSSEFKKFKKSLLIFDKLVESKKGLKSREVRAMTDLEMLNLSQEIGLNLRSWSKKDSFKKELKDYVLNSYKKRGVSGLPASYDFIRGNETFIKEIFSDIEEDEKNKEISIPKSIGKQLIKFLNRYQAFEELYRIKRKMRMLPDKSSYSFSLFDKDTKTDNLFSEKEMKVIILKINEDKNKLFEIIDLESPSPEFYKRERELLFKKSMTRKTKNTDLFLSSVFSESYYLSNNKDNFNYYHRFSEVSELERVKLNYKEEF